MFESHKGKAPPHPACTQTGLRLEVSGAIFEDWFQAKNVQGYKRPAGEAFVGTPLAKQRHKTHRL
ncbi:MAG: hypothetical protein HN392_04270 [Anaerolineae bacterium]|jgi:hypothetical protein|nr:hypothetical protein [Anaerolineae bacterium]MBT7073284.1 hypothetical protein [Anaerolineae bacterium]MBT7781916.1 hypothetical protein [Anaerolineae bacterium]